MHCTINAQVLEQALKQIYIGARMNPFVQLQLQDGKLELQTWVEPGYRSRVFPILVKLTLVDSLTVIEEGMHGVRYRTLINAVKGVEGPITLRSESDAVLVEYPGANRQTAVEAVTHFPLVSDLPEEGAIISKTESVWEACSSCGSGRSKQRVTSDRVKRIITQQLSLPKKQLASLVKQVAWATNRSDYSESQIQAGIHVSLQDGMLQLQAWDGWYAVAQRRAPVAEGESWEEGIVIPASALERIVRLFPQNAEILVEATLVEYQHIKQDDEEIADGRLFSRGKIVAFSSGDLCAITTLLNGSLPEYEKGFALAPETEAIVATHDFIAACDGVITAANEADTSIKLSVNSATLTVETGLLPAVTLCQIAAETKLGEAASAVVHWEKVRDALNGIFPYSHIQVGLSGPQDFIMLRATDESYRCTVRTAR